MLPRHLKSIDQEPVVFVRMPRHAGKGDDEHRTGRRPLLLCFTAIAILTAYPAMYWLVAEPSFGKLLTVELWLSFIFAGYNGAMVVHLTEIVPADVRTAGFSLAYSLATTLGGSTPAIVTFLIHQTGNRAMPGAWLSLAALIAFITACVSALTRRHLTAATAPET